MAQNFVSSLVRELSLQYFSAQYCKEFVFKFFIILKFFIVYIRAFRANDPDSLVNGAEKNSNCDDMGVH